MPRRAAQSSAALVQTAGGNPLPAPAGVEVYALTMGAGTATVAWTGLPGVAFRVVDFHVVKTTAGGGVGDTAQLRNDAGNAISDAMSMNVLDQAVARAGALDDARWNIAAGGGLQVDQVNGGANNLSGIAYVAIARV